MFFDLTPEISLDKKTARLYEKLRLALYVLSILLAAYLALRILFPSLFFEFSFNTPNAKSNTITNPRGENLLPPEKGLLRESKNFSFNASLVGTYSTAVASFALDKKSTNFSLPIVSVKKSYSAFLYPAGDPLGFRDGTLLKNASDFYLVSRGELRKFADSKNLDTLGFPRNSFREVSKDELQYNAAGKTIDTKNGYPDDTLFHIQNDFYRLQDGQLKKFVSDSAFSTCCSASQAIEKNPDFLQQYPLSPDALGFSEGSLISYADSIYVVEDGKIFPIDNPLTFSGKGFDWNDVHKASADEIALYKKVKLFTIANNHPSGTIFTAIEDQKHYLIRDGKKHLLPSDEIFASWTNTTPIAVSQNSLDVLSSCQPEKSLWQLDTFRCELPIASLQNLIGSDFVFSMQPEKEVRLDLIELEFKKDIGFKNFRFTTSEILNRIRNNYAR